MTAISSGSGASDKGQADAVVVGAHIERVLVRERNVDAGAGAGALGHRRNPGLAAAGRVAHDVAEHGREHRNPVLLLAGKADDRALAVALHRKRPHQIERDGRITSRPICGARLDQHGEVGLEFSRQRILHDRDSRDLAQRRLRRLAGFAAGFVDECENFSNLHELFSSQ